MFTGIIESAGIIKDITQAGTNKSFWISCPIANELKIDQSVSHDGVCLTVEEINGEGYRVTAIDETLKKTNINNWQKGGEVNIERCMVMNGRLDGHIVQGHVDTTAICTERKELQGSWEYSFEFPQQFAALIIEKGSISLNGTSLTVFNVTNNAFSVAIIPYTYDHTSIKHIKKGTVVNIEFDMVGKYVTRTLQLQNAANQH